MHVIETKLRVYREFKNFIDSGNIFLQHIYEDFEEVAKISACKKISQFCGVVEDLIDNIPMIYQTLVKTQSDLVLTQENIQHLCSNVWIKYGGIVGSPSALYYSDTSVQQITKCIVKETTKQIGKCLTSPLRNSCTKLRCIELPDLTNHFKDFNFELFRTKHHVAVNILLTYYHNISSIHSIMSIQTFIVSVFMPVDINSKIWRTSVANEIYANVCNKKDDMIDEILHTIIKKTTTILGNVFEKLQEIQGKNPLLNQIEGKLKDLKC